MNPTSTTSRLRRIAMTVAAGFALVAAIAVAQPQQASAANAADFDPGYIVSDEVFYDSNSMTEAQIQAYLEAKVPSCRSGYTCLKDKRDNSRARAADPMCGQFDAVANERASSIIYRVSRACGINPKVLLVMLEKEQGLVTHTWPSEWRYDAAMGQGCPDTAACDPNWQGLSNQLYGSAWQLKRYTNPPGTSQYFTWYAPGKTWNIRWSPDASCGSSPVYIRNQATSSLYYYTPYQPNAAALNNLYGTGDACSAYGNRNFWRLFTDWFGDPRSNGSAAIAATASAWGAQLGAQQSGVVTVSAGANGTGSGQMFANGSIYFHSSTGARAVLNPIRSLYWNMNGPAGALGWPTSDPITMNQFAGGMAQAFQFGSVYSSTATGAQPVVQPQLTYYFSLGGGNAKVGLPTAPRQFLAGGWTQTFQNGTMATSSAGTYIVTNSVNEYLAANGGLGIGTLGWPISEHTPYSGASGQAYSYGSLYESPSGIFRVTGVMRDKYWAAGTNNLGWPIGEQACSGPVCYQPFGNGTVTLNTGSNASTVLTGAIGTYYGSKKGPLGTLGWPQSGVLSYSESGGATAAVFTNGSVYSSVSGTFTVTGAIRTAYWGAGVATLGWPTSEETCSGSVCQQSFQNGSISRDSATGKTTVSLSAIATYYANQGGASGKLGVALSGEAKYSENGGATGQVFQGGSVYSSSAGTFTVTGAVRSAYWANGTTTVGWPTSEQSCTGSICTQTFGNGTISADTASGKSTFVQGVIGKYYGRNSGASGKLGWPLSTQAQYSENGGAWGQVFGGGSVYSSTAGTFTVTGAMRNAYWAAGTTTMGWPTGEASCTGGTCTQTFQNGTLTAKQ